MIRSAPALAAIMLALGGCLGSISESEGERLRRRVAELERELTEARAYGSELETKLADANRAREEALPQDVLDALPRCAGVEIDPLSGPVGGEPGREILLLFIKPFDGQRRFVQVAGSLRIDATLIPPMPEGGSPTGIGHVSLGPRELREAYRSSFVGTHYSVELPLPQPPGDATLLVRAELVDALSGRRFAAERLISRGAARARADDQSEQP